MEIKFSKKMDSFPTSIFNELSSYKKRKINEGYDIIDLSVGSPDLPPPPFVMEELSNYAKQPAYYGYTLTGTSEFNNAVCTYYQHKYDVSIAAENEALMVMGSQDGLVHLPMVLTNPGDLILVPDPGYTAYAAGISLAEAIPYPMPLQSENNFLPNLTLIPEEVCEKAKLMILNFPGNPVPAMATSEFFEEVVQFAKKYNIIVLHDFAYCELYYDKKPISFLSVDGAKEVGIEFNSLSKSFNMAGCRIGYVVGNSEVISGLDRLKSNLDYGVFLPIQKAAIRALKDESIFTDSLRRIYRERRDSLVTGLRELGWNVSSPLASMFLWAEVPKQFTSKEFAYKLLDDAGVVVTPGIAFGNEGEGYVRIAIVQDEAVLQRAVKKIKDSGIVLESALEEESV
ncbi:aspartate/methionine/tyrosine aminotransferase [Bacillus mesophilus]|uniref:Aminotransferase n=1 Tax=Bacillus mesophilus TaxID=1808955 RepID=A0A6M0QED7_9BACI|nr:LL-diaminopimelate aminotransferase [Bacillus mesophilus]MBM7663031.1 aspartate/methionine/tyrosine aminotransferase [Bacillus mesophilus]NEY73648.1 LL-diaminopimelate aminotransferase [Bacillus mesophilus]